MRILVTGALGYIGTVMTPMLRCAGHDVVGLDCDLYGRCTYGDWVCDIPMVRKDVRDVGVADLEGFDAVIHLAALSNDPLGDLNPDLTMEINHRASVRLAELARRAGVRRFLFSSSCSIYGAAGDEILDESAPFNPVTPYGLSKMLVERDVAQLADESFSPVFLRNATAYGVSPRMRFDLVLNNLAAWGYTTGLVYLKSDGSPWRPVVHVEDISRAFLTVLSAPRDTIHNEAFNVGRDSENYRVRDLAEIVLDIIPDTRIEYAPDAGPDARCYRVNFGKFGRTFGADRLVWDARKGAESLHRSYKRFGFTRSEFEGPKYKRIEHIKMLMRSGRLDEKLRWTEA